MKMAAAIAIASCVSDDELAPDFIIPSPFNPDVAKKSQRLLKKQLKNKCSSYLNL